MRLSRNPISLLLLFPLCLHDLCRAQNVSSYLNDLGSPAYGITIPVENGYIDVSNGDLHLEFPFATHPQRGGLSLNERLVYDSRIWMFLPFGSNGSYHWWPYNVVGAGASQLSGGWRFLSGNEIGSVSYLPLPSSSSSSYCDANQQATTSVSSVNWTDPNGTLHPTNALSEQTYNPCTQETSSYIAGGGATDGSGYSVSDDGYGNPNVYDRTGAQLYPTVGDRYGNFWSKDAQGNLVDDTGRTPVIVTQNGNTTYYDVLAPNGPISNNGTRVRYTVTSASVNVNTNFRPWSISDIYPWTSPGLLTPVQSITLPDGSQYSFGYDNNGELSSMTLPTGGTINYQYTNFVDSSNTENRWLSSRQTAGEPAMTFSPKVTQSCPSYSSGCVETVTLHKPSGDETVYELTLVNGAWNTGITTYSGSAQNGAKLASTASANTYTNGCTSAQCTGSNYISTALNTTILYGTGQQSVYTQAYYSNDLASGQPSAVKTWDFAPGAPSTTSSVPTSTPARETDYSYSGADVAQIKVLDASGNTAGLTNYTYTSTAQATSGLPNHNVVSGKYLNTVSHWVNTGTSPAAQYPLTTYSMYDTGQVYTVQDAIHTSKTTYSYQCGGSLPNTVTNLMGQVTTYGFDCNSGAMMSVKDPNDLAAGRAGTTYGYEPAAGRVQTISSPDGGLTTFSYPSVTEMDTTVLASPNPSIATQDFKDSYGRFSQHVVNGNSTETTYDDNGRKYCSTNPHTVNSSTTQSTCYTSYDGLDRPLILTQADASTQAWSYSLNSVVLADETGHQWKRTMNAFGQLTSVVEMGTSTSPTSTLTNYSYDGLGNLSAITQLGNSSAGDVPRSARTFTFDSMGREVCASQSENGAAACPLSAMSSMPAGVTTFSYDTNGNVSQRTDPRGVTTSYFYDPLNRLALRRYSDGTASGFGYDGRDEGGNVISPPLSNSVGRLSRASNEANAATNYSYDPMGRIQAANVCIRTTCSNVAATYDLNGSLSTLSYPDGRTMQNGYDAGGRMSSVNYQSWSGTPVNVNYFSAFTGSGYDPAGHLTAASFSSAVYFGASYDARQRVQSRSYTSANTPKWSKQYAWYTDGSLSSYTDQISGVQRQFGYDSLKRLVLAQDLIGSNTGNGGSNGSGSAAGSSPSNPGASGAAPRWTDPDDSNVLPEYGESNAYWVWAGLNASFNSSTAPDQSNTAAVISGTSADGYLIGGVPSPSAYSGETMTGSVWLRAASAQSVNIYIIYNDNAGYHVAGSKMVQLSTTWQQYGLSGAVIGVGTTGLSLQIGGGGSLVNGQTVYMWRPMLEDSGTAGSTITNYLPYSQRLTAASWSGNQTTRADNQTSAPDGTNTGASITASPGSGVDGTAIDTIANPAPFSGAAVVGSIWLRAATSQQVLLTFWQSGSSGAGVLGVQTVTLTPDWQRFQIAGTTQTALNLLQFQIGGGGTLTNGQVIYAWGAQVELANTAGPYVATGSIAASSGTSLTNLLPFSQQPTASTWAQYQTSVAASSVSAPDGTTTAAEFTATSSSDSYVSDYVGNAALYDGALVTGSVFLRSASGAQTVNLYLYGNNASGTQYLTPQTVSLSSTWQRFQISGVVPNGLRQLALQIGGGGSFTSSRIIDVWGAQMELASSAGPYVATSALPVVSGKEYTNIFPSSQTLSGPTWLQIQGSLTSSTATAPDGTPTAAIFTTNANATDGAMANFVPNPSLYDNETVTASVYLKAAPGLNSQQINLYLIDVGNQGTNFDKRASITLTNNWQRFEVTGPLQNGLAQLYLLVGGDFTLSGGQTVQIWGAQLVVGSTAAPYSPTNSNTTYVASGQPATLANNGLNETYSYDSFGNILQNGSFNDSYTSKNQMFGYAYDAAGNLLADGVNNMTWDAENRLSTVAGATYIYDAEGNRVEKQGSSVTDTIYFGGVPIARYTAGQWTDLIYGPEGLLGQVAGTPTSAPVYRAVDHLGSTVADLMPDGSIANPVDYRPFGQLFAGTTAEPFDFTGLEHDSESSEEHAAARQYSSITGRWLSPDPYDGSMDLGNPQSLNRYAYVANSPLTYTDPSGLLLGIPLAGLDWQAGVTVGGAIAVAGIISYDIFKGIEDLLSRPTFHGSTSSRPGSQPWDEHGGYQPHPYTSVADILGLGNSGCEFGACGGGFGPGQGNGSSAPSMIPTIFVALPYLDIFDLNHRFFGTHYCGPGGGGDETDQLDRLCHIHDDCYANLHVSANVNLPTHHTGLDDSTVRGLRACNQALYNGAGELPLTDGTVAVRAWLRYGFQLLYPGTEAQ